MEDTVDIVNGVFVRRGTRGLEAAALVDGHVDHHRAGLHLPEHVARNELRGLGAGDQHRADHQVGMFELFADIVFRRHQGLDVLGHHVGQVGEALQRNVADRHVGPRPGSRTRRGRTDHTGADDEDPGGLHPRYAAQQLAFAAAGFFEEIAPFLRGHTACDLGHRDQQRQRAVGTFDGLVGAAYRPAVDHGAGKGFAAGEMEEREDQLVFADQLVLGGDGLLDLDDHFGTGIDIPDRGKDLRPYRRIGLVGKTAVHTGRSLHINRVAPLNELLGACGGKGNAILVVLDLFGNTDNHKA